MTETIVIDQHYQGPPFGANGGICVGLAMDQLVSGEIPCAAQVSLFKPIPLDEELGLSSSSENGLLLQGEEKLVEAVPYDAADVLTDIPGPVDYETALAAEEACVFTQYNPFPNCYVCGHLRRPKDAPRLMSGPVAGRDDGLHACIWRPSLYLKSINLETGTVSLPDMVTVLDCPSAWAIFTPEDKALLGRQQLALLKECDASQEYIVTSWPIERQERKLLSGAAIYNRDGDLMGAAKSIWVKIS